MINDVVKTILMLFGSVFQEVLAKYPLLSLACCPVLASITMTTLNMLGAEDCINKGIVMAFIYVNRGIGMVSAHLNKQCQILGDVQLLSVSGCVTLFVGSQLRCFR